MSLKNLSIIIPTLNEEENISILLHKLTALYPETHIIVVDDNSSDNTVNEVKKFATNKNIVFIQRARPDVLGLAASVITGIKAVSTEYFAVMDGDLQHPPSVINKLYEEILKGSDLVAGARLPYKEQQGLHRIFATKLSTFFARLILRSKGLTIPDPMSGLFLAKTDLIKKIIANNDQRFELAGYKILFDLLRIAGSKLKVASVHYEFTVRRESGNSKLAPKHALLFFRSLFK